MVMLTMAPASVSCSSDGPMVGGAGFRFWRVLFGVAPVAEAFQVFGRVVHEVAVAVMDLAASDFTATLTGAPRTETIGGVAGAGASLGSSCRVRSLAEALTFRATKAHLLQPILSVRASLWDGRVPAFGTKDSPTYLTQSGRVCRVRTGHLTQDYIREVYRLETRRG